MNMKDRMLQLKFEISYNKNNINSIYGSNSNNSDNGNLEIYKRNLYLKKIYKRISKIVKIYER